MQQTCRQQLRAIAIKPSERRLIFAACAFFALYEKVLKVEPGTLTCPRC